MRAGIGAARPAKSHITLSQPPASLAHQPASPSQPANGDQVPESVDAPADTTPAAQAVLTATALQTYSDGFTRSVGASKSKVAAWLQRVSPELEDGSGHGSKDSNDNGDRNDNGNSNDNGDSNVESNANKPNIALSTVSQPLAPPPMVPDARARPDPGPAQPAVPRASAALSPVASEDSADGINPLDELDSPDVSSSSLSIALPSKHGPPLSRSAFQARELMGRTPPARVGGALSPIAASSGRQSLAGAGDELQISGSTARTNDLVASANAMDATLAMWLQTAIDPTGGAGSEPETSARASSMEASSQLENMPETASSNLELTTKTQHTSESLRQFLATEQQVLDERET